MEQPDPEYQLQDILKIRPIGNHLNNNLFFPLAQAQASIHSTATKVFAVALCANNKVNKWFDRPSGIFQRIASASNKYASHCESNEN